MSLSCVYISSMRCFDAFSFACWLPSVLGIKGYPFFELSAAIKLSLIEKWTARLSGSAAFG